MTKKIKKGPKPLTRSETGITKTLRDDLVSFSFRFLGDVDEEVNPADFPEGYTRTFSERLRDISQMKVVELKSSRSKSLRCHPINWAVTSRKNGFEHLNQQYEAYEPYQFNVSTSKYGRVHGFFIDSTFGNYLVDVPSTRSHLNGRQAGARRRV